MARRKRTAPAVDRASTRSSALESIDKNLDLGNNLTLAAYNTALSGTDALLSTYNTKLSELDGLLNQLEKSESDLDDLSTRMLGAVKVKYGSNSDEYEKAGGTRASERKSPKTTKAAAGVSKQKSEVRSQKPEGNGLAGAQSKTEGA